MKNLPFCISVLLLSATLLGCATTQGLDVSKRTRVFPAPYDTVMMAAVEYCNDRGFPVTSSDTKLGILNTDYRENDGAARFFLGNARARINMNFKRLGADSTRILLNISTEKQGAFGSWSQMTGSESEIVNIYNEVFDGIRLKLPEPFQSRTPSSMHSGEDQQKTPAFTR
jgi:hypothetical protein